VSNQIFDLITVVVNILTFVAIGLAGWQLLFHSRQMHRDFEMLYVQRYWAIMDKRRSEWRNNPLGHAQLHAEDEVLIRDYLQLCEDEIDLRSLGRVTDNTWSFWAAAITGQTSTAPYSQFLSGDPQSAELYPSLTRFKESSQDPLTKSKSWRMFHGL
jgi:hypothetical protein